MSVTDPYIKKLNRIKSKIPSLAKKIVKDNSEIILNIIKFKQLGVGLNSDGLPLAWSHNGQSGTGRYAKRTQGIATGQGISFTKTFNAKYNFQWSGRTFDTMGLKTKGKDVFEIFTIDGKQKLLEEIYGEIFKLTKDNNEFINETIIIPGLIDHILNNFTKV